MPLSELVSQTPPNLKPRVCAQHISRVDISKPGPLTRRLRHRSGEATLAVGATVLSDEALRAARVFCGGLAIGLAREEAIEMARASGYDGQFLPSMHPGTQGSLGRAIVATWFRRQGFNIALERGIPANEILGSHFLGYIIKRADLLDPGRRLIVEVKTCHGYITSIQVLGQLTTFVAWRDLGPGRQFYFSTVNWYGRTRVSKEVLQFLELNNIPWYRFEVNW